MENSTILELLVKQSDSLFQRLKATSISGLYNEQYEDIKAGRVSILGGGEQQILSDLKRFSKDISHDDSYRKKLTEYMNLDNENLILYFQNEFQKVFEQIQNSRRQEEIQAIFIEYDYFYHYTSYITCYGIQEYPLIEVPRYISNEYDYNKQILFIDKGINFKPAWLNCEEFGDLDYLGINYELENLFRLHSRVLLHKALDKLDIEKKLSFLPNRPFSFFINEHDCEVMILYRLN